MKKKRNTEPKGRPMTGLFCQLTPAQRAAALAYKGDDTVGTK
jgi:hypothetical protein